MSTQSSIEYHYLVIVVLSVIVRPISRPNLQWILQHHLQHWSSWKIK